MDVAIEFGACMLFIFSSSAPGMSLRYERTRRVGSLACVASCASLGRWRYVLAIHVVCVGYVSSFYGFFIISMMCSRPIWVTRCRSGAYPRPISTVGLWMASVGKLGRRPIAFLAALLRILSINSSCVSVNIPRCVALYLDFRSWSMTSFSYSGTAFSS